MNYLDDYEDVLLAAERSLREGIAANATRLYAFAQRVSQADNVPSHFRDAAWALVTACNTYQAEPVAAGDGLPL